DDVVGADVRRAGGGATGLDLGLIQPGGAGVEVDASVRSMAADHQNGLQGGGARLDRQHHLGVGVLADAGGGDDGLGVGLAENIGQFVLAVLDRSGGDDGAEADAGQ